MSKVRFSENKWPRHLHDRPEIISILRQWANKLSDSHGTSVYLVGSALRDDNVNPRDWDIRIKLPDPLFALKFGLSYETSRIVDQWIKEGSTGKWTQLRWRWSNHCVKRAAEGSSYTSLNIDFQVYPATYWKVYDGESRLRLNTK